MSVELRWMRPDAPYMPVAVAGMLAALEDAGRPSTAAWVDGDRGRVLRLGAEDGDLDADHVAAAVAAAPWPDVSAIAWSGKMGQAIKPMLAAADDPALELIRLRRDAHERGLVAESRLLTALVTDAALDGQGVPSRSRLLRGVKADLSGIAERVRSDPAELAAEITTGPLWRNGRSGRGLGLVPEVQTFGGTTGRTPSDVGSHSVLLYRLLWLGVLALPPVGVVRGGRRTVGGPLVTEPDLLSWPVWSCPADLAGLRALFSLAQIHEDQPPRGELRRRDVVAVLRSRAVPINTMIAVFRWGERVM